MSKKIPSNPDRFLMTLIALTCRRFRPDPMTVDAYQARLSSWSLSDSEWVMAADRISMDWTDEGLPPWPFIQAHLKAAREPEARIRMTAVLFTRNGLRYAKRLSYPEERFRPPAKASDVHRYESAG